MNARPGVVLGALLLWIGPAHATGLPRHTLYVDCDAAVGGTGTSTSPYATIGAAVDAGEALSATNRVVVDAKGTCDGETFPIRLDYPVELVGRRIAKFDAQAFPIDGQYRDTLVTWPTVQSVPSTMFLITGDDV